MQCPNEHVKPLNAIVHEKWGALKPSIKRCNFWRLVYMMRIWIFCFLPLFNILRKMIRVHKSWIYLKVKKKSLFSSDTFVRASNDDEQYICNYSVGLYLMIYKCIHCIHINSNTYTHNSQQKRLYRLLYRYTIRW